MDRSVPTGGLRSSGRTRPVKSFIRLPASSRTSTTSQPRTAASPSCCARASSSATSDWVRLAASAANASSWALAADGTRTDRRNIVSNCRISWSHSRLISGLREGGGRKQGSGGRERLS